MSGLNWVGDPIRHIGSKSHNEPDTWRLSCLVLGVLVSQISLLRKPPSTKKIRGVSARQLSVGDLDGDSVRYL